MASSSLTLERALSFFKAIASKIIILECLLCTDGEFAALMAHYAYDYLYSGQTSDMADKRFLTVRDTAGTVVPYHLVDVSLTTARAIQDQTVIIWSATHEVQISGSVHATGIISLSTDLTPVCPDTHLLERHLSMSSNKFLHVMADIPLFNVETGCYSVVVQNMAIQLLVLQRGLQLLLLQQMQAVVPVAQELGSEEVYLSPLTGMMWGSIVFLLCLRAHCPQLSLRLIPCTSIQWKMQFIPIVTQWCITFVKFLENLPTMW